MIFGWDKGCDGGQSKGSFIALCFVQRNLLLRTLRFRFGHVTFNGVPQLPGIIMHFLDNTLVPFVVPLLGRPMLCAVLAMQQASSYKLPTVILHSTVSFSFALFYTARLGSVPFIFRPGSLVLIPFRSCAIFPATCLAALQSKSNITSHAKGLHLPTSYAPSQIHALIFLFLCLLISLLPQFRFWVMTRLSSHMAVDRGSEWGRQTDRTSLWTPGSKLHCAQKVGLFWKKSRHHICFLYYR